jgi:2-polyprenyl-3-methyl-5-hydroxy-6-metoxy-1,4-benzoquinol methylase
MILLAGGEPLLRADLPRLLATIRANGCAAGVVTTGRALMYPQWRERLRRLGVSYLRIQLFGCGAEHDRLTAVPGSFEQVLAGLRAWLAEDATCDVDVALTARGRSVSALLPEIEELRRQLASPRLQIVVSFDAPLVEPEVESWRAACTASIAGNEDPSLPLVVWEGLGATPVPAAALALAPLRPRFLGSVPPASCLGTRQAMIQAAAARPQLTLANSFNYLRGEARVPYAADPAACTAYAHGADLEPQRQLWLIEDDQLTLYTSDTGDFAVGEIAQVKSGLSHLFIDRAAAGVLDDFTEGMRRVLPDPVCDGCEQRRVCGRRYRMIDGPPYAREEAWIASYITRLRGRVLDVGCGEQLYRPQIGALLQTSAISYTGLDPDQISLASARAALPQGRYQLGGIEDFHGQPQSYDHILCLRSLNHVVDVDEAMARMASLLKPGGSLLIVECTPFAMLRRAEQVAAADRAPRAGHQHLRNLASDEVIPFARRRSLAVVEHQPAALHSSNEWILLLRREAESGS